ncbi:enoyl-CoA hydratase/isomerase family protein [Actinomadura terrae]|uniref:enoyl-CoA hydratase/isomerase family protein n=1 Tax=Actinomadura terrae TaxID=604353 RepID=UPI001FA715B4|nr:enoyl-CoA hydratase-related protein [Actinomadura terrae]
MDGVSVVRDGHVVEIVLDRAEALNALSTAMARRLAAVCREVGDDPSARAVVLSAAGEKAFCVGADLKERNGMTDAEIFAQRPVFRAAFGGVLGLPQPVIAAVHGYALGGGCEFALSADMIVADETAVFGLPEVGVGLVPGGGGTQLALRRLGPGRAADLVFTGRRVKIDEAVAYGLADRRVAAGTAREEALAIAGQIARNSPTAVRAAKRAMRLGGGVGLDAALDLEENAWRTAAGSPDRREGIAAFNEKRTPNWS